MENEAETLELVVIEGVMVGMMERLGEEVGGGEGMGGERMGVGVVEVGGGGEEVEGMVRKGDVFIRGGN